MHGFPLCGYLRDGDGDWGDGHSAFPFSCSFVYCSLVTRPSIFEVG